MCSPASSSPARLAQPRAAPPGLTRDSNVPARRHNRLFPSVTAPSRQAGHRLDLDKYWKRGNNSKYKSVTSDGVCRSTYAARDAVTCSAPRRPYGYKRESHQWVLTANCPAGTPAPIPLPQIHRALTGRITRRSAPLIINNLPTAPDGGNSKTAAELPAVCQAMQAEMRRGQHG